PAVVPLLLPDEDETVRILERAVPSEERDVDDAEEDGVAADGEGQRRRGGEREARALRQGAGGVAQGLPEGFHAVPPGGGRTAVFVPRSSEPHASARQRG